MKIDFLLMRPDAGTDTERSVFTQAGLLADTHGVSVVGVQRTERQASSKAEARFAVKYLLDTRDSGSQASASMLVPREWDDQFTADTDRVLVEYFRRTSADVLVTTTPALAALAAEFAPPSVRIVHQQQRGSEDGRESIAPLISHGARLDLLVTMTAGSASWWREKLGAAAPQVEVMSHALDGEFRPRSLLLNRTIVGAGPLVEEERFGHLVKAFTTANELVPGWRLRIYGDGPLEAPLQQAVWRSGLAGQVDIVRPTSRVPAELSKASIFASTSQVERLSLHGLEAAAAGVPMVAFELPNGAGELIGESGLLVPDDEHVSFGVALAYLMSDADVLDDYSARARVSAANYAPALAAPRWEAAYQQVMNREPRRGSGRGKASITRGNERHDSATEVPRAAGQKPSWFDAPRARAQSAARRQPDVAQRMCDRLTERGVRYAKIRDDAGGFRVGLDEACRADVIECLDEVLGSGELACVAQRGDSPLSVEPWTSLETRPVTVKYGTVFRIVDGATDGEELESLFDIELWHTDARGARFAPRSNSLVQWVEAETWDSWAASGADTPSGYPTWNSIDFPIDVVYTWVDGSDPKWDSRRRAAMAADKRWAGLGSGHDSVSSARFVSRDEIYFSVSAVKRFMPWVRNVFVVTAGQVHPGIAETYPDVTFVDHRDIFPDTDVLPVFNSRAIESCIHRIEGLSEQFIYFNDDVMVTRALTPDAFFQGNGAARFFPSDLNVNYGANDDAPHLQAASNNRALILRDFGVEITQTMLHTPHPHRRSVLLELEERYAEQFASTRSSKFRSANDLSTLSSLAQYYGWATGQYVIGSLNYRYLRLTGGLLRYRMATILQDDALEVVALGEPHAEDTRHPDERGIVKEFLELLTGVTRKVE